MLYYSIGGLTVQIDGGASLAVLADMPAMRPFQLRSATLWSQPTTAHCPLATSSNSQLSIHLDAPVAAPTGAVVFEMPVGLGRCRVYADAASVLCELVEENSEINPSINESTNSLTPNKSRASQLTTDHCPLATSSNSQTPEFSKRPVSRTVSPVTSHESQINTTARIRYDIGSGAVSLSPMPPQWLHFALWLAYNMQASAQGRFALHAAAAVLHGEAALFLGESGTGKSTHARQWMAAFPGCRLLNDDSPVVAFAGGEARVYGSPWSGKTPCYIPDSYPLCGLVRLSQAPRNAARRLGTLEAIAALVPSFPPMLVHVEPFRSRMLALIETLVNHVHVLRLDCLPDTAAAHHCRNALHSAKQV